MARRLKVVQIIPTLDRSGAEKQLALLSAHLDSTKFETQVVCLTRGGPYEETIRAANIPVTIIGKKLKLDPFALWRLRKLLDRERPHIVHTWLFAANAYGRWAARKTGVPVIIAGERCVDRWKRPYEFRVDAELTPSTDIIVGNAAAVGDFYRQRGVPQHKIRVIPNAVDDPPVADDRATLRRELGLREDTFVIGCVCRLAPQKRIDDVLWIQELLRSAGVPSEIVIVGDGPERTRLERFARDIGYGDSIHFLGRRDDARRLYPAFDVVALASRFEGMPNTVLEAMAAGVAVVASDVDGSREVIVDGETGFLFPVGQRGLLARSISQLYRDPELRSRFADAGQRRVHELYTVERMVQAYEELYLELATVKRLL